MSVAGAVGRSATRWTVWARILIVAEVVLTVKRHLDLLDPEEKRDLNRIVRKSRGKPANLTGPERERLVAIVSRLEPGDLARNAAATAATWRRGR